MSKLPRPRMENRVESFVGPRAVGDRRRHRRHDLEGQGIVVDRWDGARKAGEPLGKIIDISAGGVRLSLTLLTGAPVLLVNVTLVFCAEPGANVCRPGGPAAVAAAVRTVPFLLLPEESRAVAPLASSNL